MMILLAKELQRSGVGDSAGNVAVAAIDETTFVGKAVNAVNSCAIRL
jgi:hypothetical protein